MMADTSGVAAAILDVRAPQNKLLQRLQTRARNAADVSEAGMEVLDFQRSTLEPLSAAEAERSIVFTNDGCGDIEKLCASIRRYRQGACRQGSIPHSVKSFRHR
jgi:predicted kinase